MKIATRKTGMISGSQAEKMALWLEYTIDHVMVDDHYCYDCTERVLAKYPALTSNGRVASYLILLATGDIRVVWG